MKTTKELKEKGYLHYFDWEMYLLICISYMFGFGAGLARAWVLPISFLFLGIPYYMKYKSDRK
jgi:hypothetical protein